MPNWGYIWEFLDDGVPVQTDTLLTDKEVIQWGGYLRNGFRRLEETKRDRDVIDRAKLARANRKLPVVEAFTQQELRDLWRQHRGNKDIERYREIVQKSWNEATNGSNLVALHQLCCLIQDKCRRAE